MKSARPRAHSPYSYLGRFYDEVTRGSPAMNRHARKKILGKLLPRIRSVCDLGCGSGTTAVELARGGREVHAVDASPTQCRQARAKSRKAGVAVRVIHADMRTFRLPERVELVICEFNPLNHLGRKRDLERAFRAVSRALLPGGWFYFDLNMRPMYEEIYPVTRWDEHDGFCVLSRGAVDRRRSTASLELDWFIADGSRWVRRRERIVDAWWSDAEIREALRKAGFASIRAWDGADVRPRRLRSRRGFDRYYLARKPSRRDG